MGYYTNFDVSVESQSTQAAEDAAYELAKMSDYSADMTGKGTFSIYEAKWYNWEEHVRIVSKNHPGVVFYLEGEGEESGDIWRAWAHAGEVFKSQAVMTFAEPEWLPQAKNDAGAVVAALHAAEQEAGEQAERDELARLKAKYEDD